MSGIKWIIGLNWIVINFELPCDDFCCELLLYNLN